MKRADDSFTGKIWRYTYGNALIQAGRQRPDRQRLCCDAQPVSHRRKPSKRRRQRANDPDLTTHVANPAI